MTTTDVDELERLRLGEYVYRFLSRSVGTPGVLNDGLLLYSVSRPVGDRINVVVLDQDGHDVMGTICVDVNDCLDKRESGCRMYAYTLQELRAASDEELITRHDQLTENTGVGVNYFLEELARRDAARQMRTMTVLTWWIAGFTLVNVIATIAGLLT